MTGIAVPITRVLATFRQPIDWDSVRNRKLSHNATREITIARTTERKTIPGAYWHIAGSRMASMPI